MRRFFVKSKNIREDKVLINSDEAKHIVQVLRLKAKDKIKIFNENGNEYVAEIVRADKKEVIGKILEKCRLATEPPIELTLVQGLPKSNKMDFVVQKVAELGGKKIIPVITRRTIVRLDKNKAAARQRRWQKIAREAAKQSGRSIIPSIEPVTTFIQSLENIDQEGLYLIPWEESSSGGLKAILCRFAEDSPKTGKTPKRITVFIGPEGGFTPDEVRKAREKGAISLSLGPRLLRTETAGLVTLAMILYELGDMG
jgi:16S rRNA (uracil1498-N3)-methyltransferase